MGRIKGWKKVGDITSSSGTVEETYYSTSRDSLLRVSVTRWGDGLRLDYPVATVFVEEDTGREWRQFVKKEFSSYDSAKQFALSFMRRHP